MIRLGRYSLLRRVGTGGMAEVWKAKAQGPAGFEKIVAIKRVLPNLAADREFVEMFIEEAKLVARLEHHNIVQVFDFGMADRADPEESTLSGTDVDTDGEPIADYFLAMEYVAGQNLANVLRRLAKTKRAMPVELAMHVTAESAAALAYAHDMTDTQGKPLNIVHRDVSPQNVLLTYRGEVKVTDFGIAKVASALSRTGAGMWKGKIAYMSPEQARLLPLDRRSDLFALGLVLYELVSGDRLFRGNTSEEIFERITKFIPDEAALEAVPELARPIVQKALQIAPGDRYADAAAMEAALSDALGSRGGARAKAALAALMQELFENEQKKEQNELAVAEPITEVERAPDEAHPGSAPTLAPPEARSEMRSEVPETGPSNSEMFALAVQDAEENPANRTTVEGREQEATLGGSTAIGGGYSASPGTGVAELAFDATQVSEARRIETAETLVLPKGGPADSTRVLGSTAAAASDPISTPTEIAPKPPGRIPKSWIVFGVAALAIGLLSGRFLLSPGPATVASPTPTPTVVVTPNVTPMASATAMTSATAMASATAMPSATARPATPRPTATRVAAVVGTGSLTVLADPWVEVWVDGKRATAETPLRKHTLSAGKHVLHVKNARLGFDMKKTIDVSAGVETKIFVDVAKKSIQLR